MEAPHAIRAKKTFDAPGNPPSVPPQKKLTANLFSRPIRNLAILAAAVAIFLTAPAHAASKSEGKKPPQKIDPSKLKAAASLYDSEAAKKPASKSLSVLGFFASRYKYDSRMLQAAEIASSRAYAHSHGSCWRYVKNALVSADVIDSRPKTGYAKQAAEELTGSYGFKKINCNDPYKAPPGSVLVYGGRGAGHVEFRTKTGFVSDFSTVKPSTRPLIGVYVKP